MNRQRQRAVIQVAIRDADGKVSTRTDLQRRIARETRGKRLCLIGGGNGTGKTNELCLQAARDVGLSLMGKLPPLKILFAHKSDSAALKILIREKFLKFLPLGMVDKDGNKIIDPKTKKQATLFRGMNKTERQLFIGWPGTPVENCCTIEWSGLDASSGCIERLQNSGTDYDKIIASQVDSVGVFNNEDAFFALRARLGRRTIPGYRQQLLMDANPCMGWPNTRFVMGLIDPLESPEQYYFTSSRTDENPHLSEQYRKERASLPPSQKSRYHDGIWGATEGSIYPDFGPANVVLWNQIPFELSWSIKGYLDAGNHPDPFSILIIALNHFGDMIILAEKEIYRMTARQKAEKMRELKRQVLFKIATTMGRSLAEIESMWKGGEFGGWFGPSDLNIMEESGKSKRQQLLVDYMDDNMQSLTDEQILAEAARHNRWRGLSVQTLSMKSEEKNKGAHQSMLEVAQQLVSPLPGHKHLFDPQNQNAPRLYICNDCPATMNQFSTAVFDGRKLGYLDQTRVRNRFYTNAENGMQDDTHHWDLHSAFLLASMDAKTVKNPTVNEQYTPGFYKPQKRKNPNAIFYT